MSNIHTEHFLKGIFPVVPTPLKEDASLDLPGLEQCLDMYMGTDVHGITVLGSGGELPYFSDVEQLSVVKHVKHVVQNKKPIIVGVDAFSVEQALSKIAQYQGMADAVMLLFNGYYQQDFHTLKEAVEAVASASDIPVLYYHFPQVTGHFLSAEQLSEILNNTGVVGVKDSALHVKSAKTVLRKCPNIAYFSGLSLLLPELVALGAAGTICSIAAIAPIIVAEFYEQCLKIQPTPSLETSRNRLIELLPIVSTPQNSPTKQYALLRFVTGLPFSILKQAASPQANSKEALRILGIDINAVVRRPLPALSTQDSEAIVVRLKAAKLL